LDPEAFTSEESSNKRGVHEMGAFSTHWTAGKDLSAPKDSLTTITQDNDNGWYLTDSPQGQYFFDNRCTEVVHYYENTPSLRPYHLLHGMANLWTHSIDSHEHRQKLTCTTGASSLKMVHLTNFFISGWLANLHSLEPQCGIATS
jgi:hypothetical protein